MADHKVKLFGDLESSEEQNRDAEGTEWVDTDEIQIRIIRDT